METRQRRRAHSLTRLDVLTDTHALSTPAFQSAIAYIEPGLTEDGRRQ